MKTILSIIPYGITVHDFFVLRNPVKEYPSKHFFNSLPEWCVRGKVKDGRIDYTENYHQFTGLIDDTAEEVFYLFDIYPVDEILKEEISNVGFEGLFEGYNWRPLFEKIPLNEPPHKSIKIPFNIHVVVELNYESMDDGEYDLIVEVLGFLDGRMDLRRI